MVEVKSAEDGEKDDDAHGEISIKNTINVTEDQLNEEQRQATAHIVDGFKAASLQTHSMVGKGGKIIQKTNFPTPRHITITEDLKKFQEMMKSNWTPGDDEEQLDFRIYKAMLLPTRVLEHRVRQGSSICCSDHLLPTDGTQYSPASAGSIIGTVGI